MDGTKAYSEMGAEERVQWGVGLVCAVAVGNGHIGNAVRAIIALAEKSGYEKCVGDFKTLKVKKLRLRRRLTRRGRK